MIYKKKKVDTRPPTECFGYIFPTSPSKKDKRPPDFRGKCLINGELNYIGLRTIIDGDKISFGFKIIRESVMKSFYANKYESGSQMQGMSGVLNPYKEVKGSPKTCDYIGRFFLNNDTYIIRLTATSSIKCNLFFYFHLTSMTQFLNNKEKYKDNVKSLLEQEFEEVQNDLYDI